MKSDLFRSLMMMPLFVWEWLYGIIFSSDEFAPLKSQSKDLMERVRTHLRQVEIPMLAKERALVGSERLPRGR